MQRQAFVDRFDDLVREFRLGTALQPLNRAIATATATLRHRPEECHRLFRASQRPVRQGRL